MSYVYSEKRRKRKDKQKDKKKHPYKRGGKERVRGKGKSVEKGEKNE